MGVLTSAVHWWEESQLRVLVLSSLAIQFLLYIFSFWRRQALRGWARFMMWLAYIGGDAVAIYALSTLFNRHKRAGEDGGGGSNDMLEVVWAPILLLHLGGDDGITAYNIEDNELWSRHLLTSVSQVTVAIYVFCKTWPRGGGDKRLLQTAIVLFVPGVFKCFQRPWVLKSASIYNLVSSPAAVKQEMYPLEKYVTRAKEFVVREPTEAEGAWASATSTTIENEGNEEPAGTATGRSVRQAAAGWRRAMLEWCNIMSTDIVRRARAERIGEMLQGYNETFKLFVDLSSSYSRRLSILVYFYGLTEKRAYGSVRQGLATVFLLLYTKLKTDFHEETDTGSRGNFFSLLIRLSRLFLPLAAIGLFHHSHREAYNDIDVKVTYVILCCTAVLENLSASLLEAELSSLPWETHPGEAWEEWPEMVAQRSFIGYVARSTKHSNKILMIVSRLLGLKDFLEQHCWYISPCYSSSTITGLVHQYLKDGWKQKMHDAASYRRFNDNRGHWALKSNELEDELGSSIKGPFDESVLRWHIATDFCFFSSSSSSDHRCAFAEVPPLIRPNKRRPLRHLIVRALLFLAKKIRALLAFCSSMPTDNGPCSIELTNCKAVLCRQMSNYMAYLLLVNPEMLLPGSRRNLFTRVQEELEAILNNNGDKPPPGLEKRELTLMIISKLESSPLSQGGSGPIHDAWLLAQKLQSLGDQKMWEVIQGVWVEMLCYSAGRCRGYLHAKALGQGGEFLSYVWLLMFYMGMETFTDKLQREDLPCHEAAAGTGNNNVTTAPPSTSERVCTTGGTAASASEVHADVAGASTAPSTSEISMDEDDMV